ncbi:MAG: HK97 family phage prohead protease [Rickettsiales bacterium]
MYYDKKIGDRLHECKRLDFSLDVKTLDIDGRFAGYASVFDVVDNHRDIILYGAFAKTLLGRIPSIKLLWQHQQDEPIGVFNRMFEDERGLYVEGQLLLDVQRAKEAYALLKAEAISGLSIGYSPISYHVDEETGIRRLSEVDLWEISLVTFPANSEANVTVVKGGRLEAYEPEWETARKTGQLIELADALDMATRSLNN